MNRYDIILGKKPIPRPASKLPEADPEKYYLGIDFSVYHGHFSAIAVCHMHQADSHIVVDYLEQESSSMDVVQWIRNINARYPIRRGIIEAASNLNSALNGRVAAAANITTVPKITNEMRDFYNHNRISAYVYGDSSGQWSQSPHKADALTLSFWALYLDTRLQDVHMRGFPRYYGPNDSLLNLQNTNRSDPYIIPRQF